jgi:hypothetical protein
VKVKRRLLYPVLLLLIMILSIPGIAYAEFDEYGYNAQARMFIGTLENWEALLQGLPPEPFNPKETDIVFVERKWNKLFDPMIHFNPPLGAGAWQKARLWKYLSGDQLGWTWHQDIEVVYSPDHPIPGAFEIPQEAMGLAGFYCTVQKEYLQGPNRQKIVIQDFCVKKSVVIKAINGLE